MNLSFDGAVAFEVPVMFANSRNACIRESRNRKAWEQAELHPHNAKYPSPRQLPY